MPYSKVQFIAYCIHTGPKKIGTQQQYMGIDPTAADITERIKLVRNAINMAKVASSTKQADPTTLKIFMMPEFFFRGRTGAYSLDEIQTTISELQKSVKDPEWQHWLFVFGSMIGSSAPARWAKNLEGKWRMQADRSGKEEVYNVVLVQKGGFGDKPEAAPTTAKVVMKEHISGMDFIKAAKSSGGLEFERVFHLSPAITQQRSEEQYKAYDGSSVFEIDGIRFGLEVCLDHAKKRLKNSKNLPTIDIQLVPSCGMTIKEDAIVAKTNGYVFHCDGYANYPEDKLGYDSRVKQIKAGQAHSEVLPLVSFPLYNVQASGIKIDEIYALGAGRIQIYPNQPLTAFSSAKNLFPIEAAGLALSLADAPVMLNGMKVVFDQSIGVYPVTLESTSEERRNAIPH
jgi:hypothetical protein